MLITRHYLGALKNDCDARQARLLAAFVPGQAELDEDNVTSTEDLAPIEQPAYRAAFFHIAHDLSLETLDLLPLMRKAKRGTPGLRLTFVHDFHWNAEGHAVAARAIAAKIPAATSVAARPTEIRGCGISPH